MTRVGFSPKPGLSEIEVDGKITTHAGVSDAHHSPTSAAGYGRLTAEGFRLLPGSGNMDDPSYINDNNLSNYTLTAVQDEYLIVMFAAALRITQFRQHGNVYNDGDGAFTLQYMDTSGNWQDWKTGVATRATEDWGGWDSSGGEVVAIGIKLICTTIDGGGSGSVFNELEVKY